MKASELYQNQYVAAEDLPNKPLTVEIAKVTAEDLKDPDGKIKKRLVLAFKGAKKRLVLNVTNTNMVKRFLGDETDNWPGNSVVLTKAQVMFNNRMVDAIRVMDVVQKNPPPPPPETGGSTDGDQPF